MPNRYADNGQYELGKAVVTTRNAQPVELDVSQVFNDIVIYESIYNEVVSGNISIVDTANIVTQYSLGNREKIEIQFKTSGVEDYKKIVCQVYKVSPPTRLSDHSNGHILYFASEEMLNSISKKVFTSHTEEISSIVQRLYDGVKRQEDPKPINVTKTRNIEDHLFTGNETFAAIHKLANKAISTTGSTGYVFYEDDDQFNFVPLEELYQKDPVTEYVYKTSGTFQDVNNRAAESFNAYQDFTPIDTNSSHAEMVSHGLYGSRWAQFSIMDKSLQVVDYNTKSQFDQTKSLGKTPVDMDANFNSSYSDKLFIGYGGQPKDNFESLVRSRMNKIRSVNSGFSIGSFGDSTIRVGSTCIAHIPNWTPGSMQPTDPDRDVLTGKFLIAEIKHVINHKTYTQRIRLTKDAYEESTS